MIGPLRYSEVISFFKPASFDLMRIDVPPGAGVSENVIANPMEYLDLGSVAM